MNFLRFEGSFRPGRPGRDAWRRADRDARDARGGGGRKLVLGVRPEHVHLSDSGAYRGRIEATEYLGTTQIVTLSTPHGTVKARIPSGQAVRVGETVGLRFTRLDADAV